MAQFNPRQLAKALEGRKLAALALEAGVTEQSLRNWLRGTHKPNMNNLERVASATGKTVDYFFQEGAA